MLQSQIHKRINFNFEKQKLIFDTSMELFSYASIDQGTKEILNSLRKNTNIKYKKILDLGCGYGIIGIFLKSIYSGSEVHCVDRDLLAIEFTKHNAELNKKEINAYDSLGFEALGNIKEKFNLIITNFPAKLEKEGLEQFIFKSSQFLEESGVLAIVVVKELKESIEEILNNENIEIKFKSFSQGYCVYHLQFKKELKSEESYTRNEIEFEIEDKIYKIKTANSLREFDNLHFITQLIAEFLPAQKAKEIFIQEPNNGHLALLVLHFIKPNKINLISKDLLSLKFSKENLEQNKFSNIEVINSDFTQSRGDLLIWSLHDEDDKTISEKLKTYKRNFKKIIIGGRLPVLKRIIKRDNLKIMLETQKNGYVAVVI
jgi:16S rRNA (guanine1207-N2)-methyltransferase